MHPHTLGDRRDSKIKYRRKDGFKPYRAWLNRQDLNRYGWRHERAHIAHHQEAFLNREAQLEHGTFLKGA